MQEEEERKREAELRIGWSSSMSLMSNKKRIQRHFDKGFVPLSNTKTFDKYKGKDGQRKRSSSPPNVCKFNLFCIINIYM